MNIHILIIISFIFKNNAAGFSGQTQGDNKYFEVLLDRIETILETPSMLEFHLRVRKINKTRALIGHIMINEPFGNNIKVEIKALKKQGGEYRFLPYNVPKSPFCDFCAKDEYVYPDFAERSDFPKDIEKECPLKPGNYSINGVAFKLENIPRNAVQSGEYSAKIMYYKDDQLFGHYQGYAFVNNV